ncbi:exodeoxyribonuclease III [Phenylobacterium sp. J367]|uniref:exodeoxyribonuclease III n=1 Tax=Phenylobacterium sp. J367 TaxID=2898435 RepID=UPI0021510592|nr:exodeoxyribonuclease III [Phenylobacterium sp. J367]MCR5879695.1 exodeoxyribonuclease III [Phenylobacterium sp. J367]
MRIATFNVNGIISRLPRVLEWLAETQPDVVCLQELKAPDERFPAAAIERAGYGAIWQGQKSWNGVAILARGAEPIEVMRGLPGDPSDAQSRYLEAAVQGVLVACLYAPNGNPVGSPKFEYKLRWYERFMARADALLATGHPVVLAGDYNIIPTDMDVYVPDRWRDDALFQPVLKEGYAHLIHRGWRDALRARYPDERIYTFWKHWRNSYARDAGLRIDHILLSPSAAARMQDAGVDREHRGREKPSDHGAVWVTLQD